MNVRLSDSWLCVVLAGIAALCTAAPAMAQVSATPTSQTLDRVAVFGATRVVEMAFADPTRTVDVIDDGISGAGFLACKLTATSGLYCLDGRILKRWPNPKLPAQFTSVLQCDDPVLRLDTKKPNPCTSMTVDQQGAIWLAGRKANSHSLLKVLPKIAGLCPTGFTALSRTPALCAREYAAGRPLILDLSSIDGDAAADLNPGCAACASGTGLLALEDRKKVVFFRDQPGATPVDIASGKSGWSLLGGETLQSATLLQIRRVSGSAVDSYALVTTSTGRVMAVDTGIGGSAFPVFNVPVERRANSAACNALTPLYGLRASSKSMRVYLSDRTYCQVVAAEPVADTGKPFKLANVQENGADLTLSTGGIAVDEPTLAPGIALDFADCFDSCDAIPGPPGGPAAATFSGVQLGSVASGLTLFQIKNIPDCRYIPATCQTLLGVTNLVAAGVIVDPDSRGHPAAQYLNVTPLLPREIRNLFDASGVPPRGLPPLWISPQYRGQATSGYRFEAFFGVPEEGVIFRETFDGEFRIASLTGSELGCVLGYPPGTSLATLRRWDLGTSVSDRFVGIGGNYIDTLANTGCGSSLLTFRGKSLLPYKLEVTPDTYDGTRVVVNNDAVFARLIDHLYDELDTVRSQLACVDVDSGTGTALPPLSAANCTTLASQWANGRDKLNKCLGATVQPKQSSGDQTCQAFDTQFRAYQSALESMAPSGLDTGNRYGELVQRSKVILHVFRERFLPSVPAGGFCVEAGTCAP